MVGKLLPVIPVLLYQWICDMKDGVACNKAWMQTPTCNGTRAFFATHHSPWLVKGDSNKVAGYWQTYHTLSHVVLLGAGHLVPGRSGAPTRRRWSRVGSESSWSRCLVHECNIFVMSFFFGAICDEFQWTKVGANGNRIFLTSHRYSSQKCKRHMGSDYCWWVSVGIYLGTYPSGFWLFFQCLSINITEGWGNSSALI